MTGHKEWANKGPDHHNWVEDPSYETRHDRVRRERGKASDHNCVDCDSSADEWSQIKGTDGMDTKADYEPRCKGCHHKYDREQWMEGIRNRDMTNVSAAASETNRKRWEDPEFRKKMSAAIAASNRRRAMIKRKDA